MHGYLDYMDMMGSMLPKPKAEMLEQWEKDGVKLHHFEWNDGYATLWLMADGNGLVKFYTQVGTQDSICMWLKNTFGPYEVVAQLAHGNGHYTGAWKRRSEG